MYELHKKNQSAHSIKKNLTIVRDADSSTRVITFIFVLAQDSNSLMSHLQQQEEFEKVTASLRQHHHFIDAISDG